MPNPFLPMTPLEEAISGENSRFQVKTATQNGSPDFDRDYPSQRIPVISGETME